MRRDEHGAFWTEDGYVKYPTVTPMNLARAAMTVIVDWYDGQAKPPAVHRVWQQVQHECAQQVRAAGGRVEDIGPDELYPQTLEMAFWLLRKAADCSRQTSLHPLLDRHRKRGTLGNVLHIAPEAGL